MAVYKNLTLNSPLTAVEFTPVSDGNFSFFYVNAPENKEALKQWLTSKEIGQEIISESLVGGQPVIVMHGPKSKEEMMKALEAHGEKLQFVPPPGKPMDTWKVISMLAVPGQAMQFAASCMKKGGGFDWGLGVFAGSNLLGHFISWIYGSQKSDDVNRLQFIKKEINQGLLEHLPTGKQLPVQLSEEKFRTSSVQWLEDWANKQPDDWQRENESKMQTWARQIEAGQALVKLGADGKEVELHVRGTPVATQPARSPTGQFAPATDAAINAALDVATKASDKDGFAPHTAITGPLTFGYRIPKGEWNVAELTAGLRLAKKGNLTQLQLDAILKDGK